jgi:DNA-binding transcriptional ArsR family regulator
MSPSPARAAPAELDRTLAALADPHRRRVVDLLSHGPRAAGDLARELALTPPAMSRHLRTLRQSGLVEESHPTFDARVRIYALRPEPMANLLRWLEEAERLWSEQLAAFKAHLERPAGPEPDPRSETDE